MSKKDQTQAAVELPEAGYARAEELKRRADELMAEAEQLMREQGREAIDPARLNLDNVPREVRAAIDLNNEVHVSNKDKNFRYAWIYRDPANRFGGRFVYAMKALGWEVVSGPLKEAEEHRSVTGERWVSDCLLMRIRLDHYARLRLRDRENRLRQQEGITAGFFDAANRRGVRVFDQTTMPDYMKGYMESMASARRPAQRPSINVPPARVLRQSAARKLAMDKLSQQIRDGSVEGLTPEQATRR